MRLALLALTAATALTAAPALAQDTPEGGAWMDCTVSTMAVYRDRVVLKCGGVAGGETPREFAMEMNDRLADVVIRLAADAKGRGKALGVLYVKASAANPAGCSTERCRRLVAVELR